MNKSLLKEHILNTKTWSELNNKLSQLTHSNQDKLAGDIFEYLSKLYFQTVPHYKSKLKDVFLLHEIPVDLKTKLNIPERDEGIDLILVTNDEEYWAVQCKYRSNSDDTLTIKGDLATFNNLAFTHCNNISHAIVCSTVNKPPKKLDLIKSIGFELIESWQSLDHNDLYSEIKTKILGAKIDTPKLRPKPHQLEAIDKTLKYLENENRGKIIMPCGSGKSLTSLWIAKELKSKAVLIAVPSLALLSQTLKVWTREFSRNNIKFEWLCVCSDKSIEKNNDDFTDSTSDLGFKVTTNPDEVKKFVDIKNSKIKLLFTTYQSGEVTAIGAKDFKFDLGILDEAHKTVGSKENTKAHLLSDENIHISKRIFMTATERVFRANDGEFFTMDDKSVYGQLIYDLNFKDAIAIKPPIISDYKIVTFNVTNSEIEEITRSNKFLKIREVIKDITARELATCIGLRKAIKEYNLKNVISFHRTIKRAANFSIQQNLISEIYPELGTLNSFHIRGDMPTSKRLHEIKKFTEGDGLLTNARCLTEGVDLPAIDCVCFVDPKRSKVDIVQAVGRALRVSKGKKFGYVLIPIFVDDSNDLLMKAEEQGFLEIVSVVRALAVSDVRVVDYLKQISMGSVPTKGSPVDGLVSVKKLLSVDADKFNRSIQLKIWDNIARYNWRPYEDAKKYAQSLNLKNSQEWSKHTQTKAFPKDIPTAPNVTYKTEWESMGEFLGTKNVSRKFRNYKTYDEAKKFVKSLKLKNTKEWNNYVYKINKDLSDIPKRPNEFYKNEWKSWNDFLGSDYRDYLPYEETKAYVKSLNIKNIEEYRDAFKAKKFAKKLHSAPDQYFEEFEGWGVFLGTGNKSPQQLKEEYKISFSDARKYAHSLNLKSNIEWKKLAKENKLPNGHPKAPNLFYKSEWTTWNDFLGKRDFRTYISYDEAKKIIHPLELKSMKDWFEYAKSDNLPAIIPIMAEHQYRRRKEWKSWADFLGYDKITRGKSTLARCRNCGRILKTWKRKNNSDFCNTACADSHAVKNKDKF